MSEISEKILTLVEQKEISYGELSKKTNIPKSALQRYATGETPKIPIPRIEAIAKALGVSAAWIMGWDDEDNIHNEAVQIPVLGYVRAGIPMNAIENILDYEEISQAQARTGDFFGLQIKGDSMEPRITDGDIVIVKKQETVENGEIAVVLVNGDDATVKKFYRTDAGVKLVSTNPKYDPFFYTPAEVNNLPVTIIGKVVELRAKF